MGGNCNIEIQAGNLYHAQICITKCFFNELLKMVRKIKTYFYGNW